MAPDPLLKAIRIIGSRKQLAGRLGISRQRLNSWLNGHVSMSLAYALIIEDLTQGQVTARELAAEEIQLLKRHGILLQRTLTHSYVFSTQPRAENDAETL